ncbi:unnamed protein product [Prorocentrum cordatum]|uniref:Uncharacterized protein n=1 Tax=Prorocentrum cordatum TaxID=2364126 RepID=A0ABN9RZY2_9DINO|nr:unnamed protein product [Polarella glacialis]
MLWLDGEGPDGKGPCKSDKAVACAPSVAFGEFSVSPIGKPAASDEPAGALETQAPTADLQHSAGGEAISAQPGDAAGMGDCLTAAAANQRLPDDSPVGRHGRLSVQNGTIRGERGRPVRLRGVSLDLSQRRGAPGWGADAVHWLVTDWRVTLIRASMRVEMGEHQAHDDIDTAEGSVDQQTAACTPTGSI